MLSFSNKAIYYDRTAAFNLRPSPTHRNGDPVRYQDSNELAGNHHKSQGIIALIAEAQ